MFDKRMNEIKNKLSLQARTVESMLQNALNGLFESDRDSCEKVFRQEESVNRLEIAIDELCTMVLALNQPEAGHLRMIITALKNNNDLERIGDHAVNICESALELISYVNKNDYILLPRMAGVAMEMFRKAVRSFVTDDAVLAAEVKGLDDTVDEMEQQILKRSISIMAMETDYISLEYHIIRIAQNLERIADLSTNIAEETIFMKEGRIVKHGENETLGKRV
jgi:phosphate transport system protein